MSIFGILGIDDTERAFVATIGQSVVYEAANEFLRREQAELDLQMMVFVERDTEDFKLRYKLPGGGRLQEGGFAPQGPYAAVGAGGEWDVAFDLRDRGAQVASSDVAMAYMSLQQFQLHLDTVVVQNVNTTRWWILYNLFNNSQKGWTDDIHGALNIEPLANGDAVLYPPVLGSETRASEDHYLASGYTSASISDTNNPIVTIVDELEHHFGKDQGGAEIVVFINNAEKGKVQDLTDFDDEVDRFIIPGDTVNVPVGAPMVPGRIIGRCNGAWVSEWDWVPANYLLGTHLAVNPPLIRRIDPADTGLRPGLQLVSVSDQYPLQGAHFRNRFGFGVGNRLNGVVMHLTAGAFAVPTSYQ